MFSSRKFLQFLIGGCAALSLHASTLTYEAGVMPSSAGFGSQVIFSETSMTTDGNVLTMTTSEQRGVWFGGYGYNGTSAQGSYLSVVARVSEGAYDWFTYFGDGQHQAIITLSSGSFGFQTNGSFNSVAADKNL